MDDKETRIKRILKTPGIFNWARLVRPREDDTQFQIENIANGNVQNSLRSAYRLCRMLALRDETFENLIARALTYKEGFSRDSSIELLEELNFYLTENQIEVVDEFRSRKFRFALGEGPRSRMLTIPTDPDFVAIRGRSLEPNFLLGWADDPLKLHQYELISAVIRISVLSRQDFVGSDARVLTFRRDKWTGKRICDSWLVSQYNGMTQPRLQIAVNRYHTALVKAVNKIETE